MKTILHTIGILYLTTLLISCGQEPDTATANGEGIVVNEAWARPADMGRISAGYFRIANFESEADTLTGVSSGVAHFTEVHESYEEDSGMAAMREVTALPIPGQSEALFEPGGLHIMFIQLTRSLSQGDEFEVTLRFSSGREINAMIPVRQ